MAKVIDVFNCNGLLYKRCHCEYCDHEFDVRTDRNDMKEPEKCKRCNK